MANLLSTISVSYEGHLTLDEEEMRALAAVACYGTDQFLEKFYGQMGRSYLEPHERGLRSLFKKIQSQIDMQIAAVDKARSILAEAQKQKG